MRLLRADTDLPARQVVLQLTTDPGDVAGDDDAPPRSETVDPRFQKLLEIRNAMAAETNKAVKTSDTMTSPTAKGAAGETSNDSKKG